MDVGVVGGGTMGVGIAHAFAITGSTVTLVEPDDNQRGTVLARVGAVLDGGIRRGRVTTEQADEVRSRLNVIADVSEFPLRPHLVVEAVPELLELKRQVLAAS